MYIAMFHHVLARLPETEEPVAMHPDPAIEERPVAMPASGYV